MSYGRELLARKARKHPPNHTIPSYPKLVDFLRVNMKWWLWKAIAKCCPRGKDQPSKVETTWRRQNQLSWASTTKKTLPNRVRKLIPWCWEWHERCFTTSRRWHELANLKIAWGLCACDLCATKLLLIDYTHPIKSREDFTRQSAVQCKLVLMGCQALGLGLGKIGKSTTRPLGKFSVGPPFKNGCLLWDFFPKNPLKAGLWITICPDKTHNWSSVSSCLLVLCCFVASNSLSSFFEPGETREKKIVRIEDGDIFSSVDKVIIYI